MTTTRFPVDNKPSPAVGLTDFSGTTTAAAALTIMPDNPDATEYRLQNLSQTEILWFNDTGGAAAAFTPGSYALAPLGYYEGRSTKAVSVFCVAAVPFSAARY
ncbi:hypothetical protein QSI79_08410 [Enterobacter asburiae]|uniref:hypothetical protein n=1 Tax=Enterobacter asburiae TaxID=61645 RepID=UPI002878F7E4|nr:hypothetical protein [Enterobacter asburiae]MDS1913320.1 hypothetical protein [Enterobacter asburiae]